MEDKGEMNIYEPKKYEYKDIDEVLSRIKEFEDTSQDNVMEIVAMVKFLCEQVERIEKWLCGRHE